jgi:hypothetical protein
MPDSEDDRKWTRRKSNPAGHGTLARLGEGAIQRGTKSGEENESGFVPLREGTPRHDLSKLKGRAWSVLAVTGSCDMNHKLRRRSCPPEVGATVNECNGSYQQLTILKWFHHVRHLAFGESFVTVTP